MKNYMLLAITAIAFLSVNVGYGKQKGPTTAIATGVVTYQGQPVEGANVIFLPVGPGGSAIGCQSVTDADGRFSMSTHLGGGNYKPGAIPGEYHVSINKLDTASITSTLAPPPNVLPAKYDNPKTSDLRAVVKADRENNTDFPLTDE